MEKEMETKTITENEIENNILPDYLQNINLQYKAKEIKKITQLTAIPENIEYNIKDIRKRIYIY
jgi:hypothetical protein